MVESNVHQPCFPPQSLETRGGLTMEMEFVKNLKNTKSEKGERGRKRELSSVGI